MEATASGPREIAFSKVKRSAAKQKRVGPQKSQYDSAQASFKMILATGL